MIDYTDFFKVKKRIECGRCQKSSLSLRGILVDSVISISENEQHAYDRIIYSVGWRHIEINGGESTDDYICCACQEELYGKVD